MPYVARIILNEDALPEENMKMRERREEEEKEPAGKSGMDTRNGSVRLEHD